MNTVRRAALLVPLAALFVVALAGCDQGGTTGSGATPSSDAGATSVVASFYPLQYFAQQVGDGKVDVYNPVPPGAEPHDLELTPRSLERIQKSKVFIYLGEGFQPAVDRALNTVTSSGLVAQDAAQGIQLMPATTSEGGTTGPASAAQLDPHIWLDPVDAEAMVANIRDALIKGDPANQATYQAGAEELRAALATLDQEYRDGLKNCGSKEIITSHAAFGYMAKRYGLDEVSIAGLSPDAEPSPARLKEIANFAKAHNVRYIFFETLVSPKVAQVVAEQAGAQTLVLNPIEGLTPEQASAGADYMSLMRDNLKNLRTGLGCR